MITIIKGLEPTFMLHTKNTSYIMKVLPSKHIEHVYYGARIHLDNTDGLLECHEFAPGCTTVYSKEHSNISLEDMKLEMSGYGKSDVREPFIELIKSDGGRTDDFTFESYEAIEGKLELEGLPCSYGETSEVDSLLINLVDLKYNIKLTLQYSVFEDADVITKSAKLTNTSDYSLRIKRLMSNQLDFAPANMRFHTFSGAWAREMHRNDAYIGEAKLVSESRSGNSSNRANPFVMLSDVNTTEDNGICYGINLVYSGNHYEAVERNAYGKIRFVSGINPTTFSWHLKTGESFQAPESVMTFSENGFNGMSQNMHRFVRKHIVRGYYRDRVRPVLLNSWEAAYFDINENKMLRLAKAAKDVGIELFVMDDGWFANRNDDRSSLGDWTPNLKKLSSGVAGIAKKIHDLGLDFGIWVEPEMVNVDSKLYKEHPDWAIELPFNPHSEGRNQRILDLTRREVQDYIISAMTEVFSSGNINYVKWDMNRNFTDYYSSALTPNHQGEVSHKYILGLYRVMDVLTKKFPMILFEGCASGGNRFDLGILSYFPQIWASDDSDAIARAEIQTGYSYGYPMSTVTAHVSDIPNHQTLRRTPIETRYHVALLGVLGYECNLNDLDGEGLKAIRQQIEIYKKHRKTLQFGRFYRRSSVYDKTAFSTLLPNNMNDFEWTIVSESGNSAIGVVLQTLVHPNTQYACLKPAGLIPDGLYKLEGREISYNIKDFGSLVNQVTPIHVKQDGMVHNAIARYITMNGENESHIMYGDAMMKAGVSLKSAFAGVGYNDNIRFYPDFASRFYVITRVTRKA
ncbi:MAG: alpha-galactosidase [Lachnospiraceae bacterium]|nr:alpha-galactosidase [Lachnospiraceae bacterium]